jgi:hypothetical protein
MDSSNLILIFACVWVLSAPVGYHFTRWSVRATENRWTRIDRIFAITFSMIFGPLMPLLAVMLVLFWKLERSDWGNQQAKW